MQSLKFLKEIKPKKFLGQNFLLNKKILKKIVQAADLKKEDVVLEVGAGWGNLTEELVKRVGEVIAIEKDKRYVRILQEKFSGQKNLKIFAGDIILDFPLILKTFNLQFQKYKIVANLPYYITSRFLRKFLETTQKPKMMVILVQKEVAKRICALPGEHSLLSLAVQYYGKPKILGFIRKEAFWPPPKVDSAILKIEVFKEPLYKVSKEKLFFQIIRAVFQGRRKQLHNSLSKNLRIPSKVAEDVLRKSHLNPKARPQDLSLSDFKNLYSVIHKEIFEKEENL